MVLVIMAAGLGSRFGGLKQAEPVDDFGYFLIDYSIFDAVRAGATKIVFILQEENLFYFKQTIGKRVERFAKTEYVVQSGEDVFEFYPQLVSRKKPFGTAHAIMKLCGIVNENFAVINADDFYGASSFKSLFNTLKTLSRGELCSVCFNAINTLSNSGAVKRGVCKIDDGYLSSIEECELTKQDHKLLAKSLETGKISILPTDSLVSMNMFGFTPEIFDILSSAFPEFIERLGCDESAEFFLPAAIEKAIREKKCKMKILPSAESWMGLTYREDLVAVQKKIRDLIDSGAYPKNLWKK